MKYINKFQKFMYGRYGADDLYSFLFKTYLILFILNMFIKNIILTIIEFIIVLVVFYRFFSKNVSARRNENKKFLEIKDNINKPLKNIKRNILDKEHIYKKCYRCKTTLKLPLPNKRGIKHAKCPNCKKRVIFFTLRKEKIEIIKDGKKIKV